MMQKYKGIYPALIVAVFGVSRVAHAGPATDQLVGIVCNFAGVIFNIAMIVGVVFALYAAFQYMSAGGDTSKVSEAHKTLTYAVIGIVVALVAGGIPDLIGNILNSPPVNACP